MAHRHTVLLLDEDDDGTWTCTQRRIDVVGEGDSATAAAYDYVRQLHESDDTEVGDD